ncbi:hypothetical protein Ddye_014778 [Dipteronia dyeriana]|uniref:DUF4283 domain-containing protein n=1 Tax=Dipteronia dyeriana TaxID=168575 RepID=A0AAD9U3Q7_9ROSI|nr:hypothetical protein Ddye_014778 [Dipteronia dyeriana]
MNAEEILKLCASMTLMERERPVRRLQTDLKEAGLQRMATSLIGKVLSRKTVNKEAFWSVMRKIRQTRDWVEIEPITANVFAFHCQNAGDKEKIIVGGPWSFDDSLIVIKEPEGKGDVHRMCFNRAEFWVQIHNAPLMCMTRDIWRFLGSIIGDVVDIDGSDFGSFPSNFLRVRVIIEIDKPLRICLRVVVLGDGLESIMLLKYERLPSFCFRYGLLGHTIRECPDCLNGPMVRIGEELLYSLWMRAPTLVKNTGFWGRQRDSREGGYRDNWRRNDQVATNDGEDGRPATRVMGPVHHRTNLNLDGSTKGIEITILLVINVNKDSMESNQDPLASNNQGMANVEDFVFKCPREVDDINLETIESMLGPSSMLKFVGHLEKFGENRPSINRNLDRGDIGECLKKLFGPQLNGYLQNDIQGINLLPNVGKGPSGDIFQQPLCPVLGSQIMGSETTITRKSKRRVRTQQNVNDSRSGEVSLGKKKVIDEKSKISYVCKKQRHVSSIEDSVEAGVDEESEGLNLPAY